MAIETVLMIIVISMNSKNKKLAKQKADRYFSEYIRLRDKNKPCITCAKFTSNKDAGHFISRRFEATRYDEKNVHGQCQKCNRFQYGNQFEFGVRIDEKFGRGTAEKILIKSKQTCIRKQSDYELIADYYKEKVNKLKKK